MRMPHHLKAEAAEDGRYRPSHEPQHQELHKDAYYRVIDLGTYREWRGGGGGHRSIGLARLNVLRFLQQVMGECDSGHTSLVRQASKSYYTRRRD